MRLEVGVSVSFVSGSVLFLFQIGAIRRPEPRFVFLDEISFYSKLVRLEDGKVIYPKDFEKQFLFQIGAIRSPVFTG